MNLQGFRIVLLFIAEQFPVRFQVLCLVYQAVPVIMPYFVPEMAQYGPVCFGHGAACHFAFHIISLPDVQGDQPVVVTGQYLLFTVFFVGHKIKRQPGFRLNILAHQGKFHSQERINEPVFGVFNHAPSLAVFLPVQVRHRLIKAAGCTVPLLQRVVYHPVADIICMVIAVTVTR